MSKTKAEIKAEVCAAIDRRADEIIDISKRILAHPELGFSEFDTARLVADAFSEMGLQSRTGLARTGVKTRLNGRKSGPTVGILGELDAIITRDSPVVDPATGAAHGCGHNAQIASMIGAGMGLQAVMQYLDGDVVLFAVPAEECIQIEERLALKDEGEIEFLVGKPELIRLGEFDDIDMITITHTPHGMDDSHASVGDTHNGSLIKRIKFTGITAHAGSFPSKGINALKAAMLGIAAIDAQREKFREEDTVRVSPIITKGGDGTSSVPADVRIETMIRARTVEAMQQASEIVDRSMRAGALAIGATVEIETVGGYLPNNPDKNLIKLQYDNCAAVVGEAHMGPARQQTGSTDVGDVGFMMPVVHPRSGGTEGSPHSRDYYVRDHVLAAVNPAKSMAMLAVDLLFDDAAEAKRVIAEAGPKLDREGYLALRRSFDRKETFPEPA
ncbi:amidohydrolase [Acuticoccus sp. M5D2P5]|uniref:amidohydrolase n=1 Tax=Acuticoccus kalidii TaxID=2910977 RepID=UPI001F2AF05E|nr:amidohydrolase [Acuticoccus kalidii]MCF3935698.1 amidohydrolase [Acuticoccus kalidii]